jgi:c-di-GMP phosphodiesterase
MSIQNLKKYAKNLTILLVEDEISLNNELSSLLSLLFKEVKVAFNGKEGFETYYKTPTDIIISDVNMPLMNGYKMAKKIKQEKLDCQIIILTAYDDVEAIDDVKELGIKDYIQKPFEDEVLFSKLESICKNISEIKNLKD